MGGCRRSGRRLRVELVELIVLFDYYMALEARETSPARNMSPEY